jgi:hypothetical protein
MNIVERLKKVFEWIERMDLRVGDIWLNPKQVAELEAEKHPGYDKIADGRVRDAYLELKGAKCVAYLWGARVFDTDMVPEDHVGALPSDWDAKLTGSAGCMPF